MISHCVAGATLTHDTEADDEFAPDTTIFVGLGQVGGVHEAGPVYKTVPLVPVLKGLL